MFEEDSFFFHVFCIALTALCIKLNKNAYGYKTFTKKKTTNSV